MMFWIAYCQPQCAGSSELPLRASAMSKRKKKAPSLSTSQSQTRFHLAGGLPNPAVRLAS